MWVGGQQRFGGKESKTPEILRSTIEVPSKIHRRSIVTSRLPHASSTLAAGWALAERAGAGRWGLGELAELKRLPKGLCQRIPHPSLLDSPHFAAFKASGQVVARASRLRVVGGVAPRDLRRLGGGTPPKSAGETPALLCQRPCRGLQNSHYFACIQSRTAYLLSRLNAVCADVH
jgi:hypothetical protein